MTKKELWAIYVEKMPLLSHPDGDEKICLTVRGFRKMFDVTWDKAHDAGVANGRALEQMERKVASNTATPGVDSLYEMFGLKK